MAAKKKSARKKARSRRAKVAKRGAAKKRAKRRATKPKTARRKPAKKRATGRKKAARKPAKRRAEARKTSGRKRAGKRSTGKKKSAKAGGKSAPAPYPVRILRGWPRPGTVPVSRGQQVVWTNMDPVGYTIEFAESPFLASGGAESFDIGPSPATVSRTVHHGKRKANYHYDLADVPREGHPPTEPQVSVGD